jgi:predicted esterase
MKKLLFGLCMLALVPVFGSAQQVARYLTAADGEPVGFYEFKPSDYNNNPNAKYPLIIFLHGIGERGDDAGGLANVLNAGIPHYINMGATMRFNVNGQSQSFLVLSPQLNYQYGSWQNFYVDEMLKYAKANLHVDLNRIYLTGLSLGGGGTWKYASASVTNASTFAAIVPVCGTCDYSNLCNISQAVTPVWAFHALDDGVVGVGCTQGAISMLQSCNGPIPPKATYYPSGNHYIWDQAYDTTHNVQSPLNVFEWMLTQSRNGSSTPPPTGNIAPVSNAGADQTVSISSANLIGSGTDQDGSISSFNWTQVSGPTTASMSNAWGASNTVSNLVAGTYVFRLKVTDNAGATATDDVNIIVSGGSGGGGGTAPVAVAGSNQTVTLPTNTAFLAGSGSYVPNGGTITGYSWSEVTGPSQATLTSLSSSNVQASNMVAGTYTYRLTVSCAGGSSTSDVNVLVTGTATPPPPSPSGGSAPVAVAGPDQTLYSPTTTAFLAGSGSYAPNGGTISSYAWSQVSGPNQATVSTISNTNVQVSNMIGGTYTFRLTVTGPGGSSTSDMHITVNGGSTPPPPTGNKSPIAVAGNNQTITSSSLQLSSWGSNDPDGSIVSYNWQKISGPSSFTILNGQYATPTISNLVSGTYVIQLTVTDNQGATGTAQVTITVNTGGSAPPPTTAGPTAAAGANQSIWLPTNSVYLYGSGSYDNTGGYITSYSWSQVNGPSQAAIGYLSTTNVSAGNLVHGTYTFQLTVTNNKGQTGTSTTQVTVN